MMKTQGLSLLIATMAGLLMASCSQSGFGSSPGFTEAKSTAASSSAPDVVTVSPEQGTGSGTTPDLTTSQDMPQACGSSICFAGKSLSFSNDIGNVVMATISSIKTDGFTASFQTPSGRSMSLNFTLQGNQLVVTKVKGWNAQFCYAHNSNPCQTSNVFGTMEYNCASALHWTGSYIGNTSASQVTCPQ